MTRWIVTLSCLVCLTAARPARATYQIGQFFNDGGSGITWTNSGNTSGTLTGTEGGYFSFTNMAGLLSNPALNGVPLPATMTITGSTVGDGFTANNQLNQPLTGPLTVEIRNANTGQDLLTATVTSGTTMLTGTGSAGAVVSATPRDNITYASDFFNASALNSQAFTVGLVGITPALSFNTTGGHTMLNNFAAASTAIFSANAVPEPASLALLGLGCVALVGARRGWRRAQA